MEKNDHYKLTLMLAHCVFAVAIVVFAFAGMARSTASVRASMMSVMEEMTEHARDLEHEKAAAGSQDKGSFDTEEEMAKKDGEQDDQHVSSNASGLTDGEYSGTAQGYGGPVTMRLVVKGGTIDSLTIAQAGGETPAYLNMAKAVIPKIIESGSADVDGVSGATYSSNGIKAASAQALKQAGGDGTVRLNKAAPKHKGKDGSKSKKKSYKKPEGGWKDGTYKGSAKGFGGTVSVKVTIKGGKIKKISAEGKHETASYWRRAQAVKGKIVKAQNPKVDAVSGATYSSNGIINAVIAALNKAGKSGRKDQVISTSDEDYAIDEGEKADLKAKAKTGLTYKSSDSRIVKVSKSGVIEGISEGRVTVTIIAKRNKKYRKASKKVTVTVFAKEPEDNDDPGNTDEPGNNDDPGENEDPGENDAPENNKINGTYTGSARGYGGQITASVVIRDSLIDSIDVEGNDETERYWFKAKKIVPKMVKKQTWDIDAVSGATYSSDGIRNAVKQALERAGLI